MDALHKAIEKAGGVTALALKLDVHYSSVSRWAMGRAKMPAKYAFRLEELTGTPARKFVQ